MPTSFSVTFKETLRHKFSSFSDFKKNPAAFYTGLQLIKSCFPFHMHVARHFSSSLWKDSKQGQINVGGKTLPAAIWIYIFHVFHVPAAQSTAVIMQVQNCPETRGKLLFCSRERARMRACVMRADNYPRLTHVISSPTSILHDYR